MSARGVFAIDRGIFDDPDFPDEQFSEREALIWLIGEAAWRPVRIRVGSSAVDLARGQCAFSTRFMAAKWKWSEARVRRWLKRLEKRGIIDAVSDAHATRITLKKYDRFQRVSIPGDAGKDAAATQGRRTSDAAATQQRRKEEDREGKEDKEHSEPKGSSPTTTARGAFLPDDWQPSEADWSFAFQELGSEEAAARQREKFRNFWFAKSGADGRKRDWSATWRNWVMKAADDGTGTRKNGRGGAPRDQLGGTVQSSLFTAVARHTARDGFGLGGGANDHRHRNGSDHGSGGDDPDVEDADWSPAQSYRAAHH